MNLLLNNTPVQPEVDIKQVCRDYLDLKLNQPPTKKNRKRTQGLAMIWLNFRKRARWVYYQEFVDINKKPDFDLWFNDTYLS